MPGMTQHARCSCPGLRGTASVRRRTPACGTTLIEAIVILAILGILSAIAMPSVSTWLSTHRVVTASNDLLHAMMTARGEALRRGRRVYVAPVDGHWRNGWTIFLDRDGNRMFDADVDELIARHDPLPASLVVANPANTTREPFTDVGSPPRPYVLFESSGHPRQRNGGFEAGSLTMTDRAGGGVVVRTLCLASFGRVRIVERASCR